MRGFLLILVLAAAACGKSDEAKDGKGSSAPKGGPDAEALVKDAKEVADQGCACKDTACLWKIKTSDGKGAEVVMARTGGMTDEQKAAFTADARRYNECEAKLGKK